MSSGLRGIFTREPTVLQDLLLHTCTIVAVAPKSCFLGCMIEDGLYSCITGIMARQKAISHGREVSMKHAQLSCTITTTIKQCAMDKKCTQMDGYRTKLQTGQWTSFRGRKIRVSSYIYPT